MRKLTIKDVVDFREKTDRSKRNFALSLKIPIQEQASQDGGGDYWVSCLSAISNSYKQNDLQPIIEKRNELEGKYETTEVKTTKIMYKRNVDILYRFEDFDIQRLRPSQEMRFLKQRKEHQILTIKGLPIQVNPRYVFTFKQDQTEEVGAIWFIAQLDGFRPEELGMFADILHRYLKTHYSKDYIINPQYCIAVDVFKGFDVNYLQLIDGEVSKTLDSSLDEIKKLI